MEATIWIWGVELESKDAVLEVPCSGESHYPKSACTEEKHWVSYASIYTQREANTAMRKVIGYPEKFRIINMFGRNRRLGSVDVISQPSAPAPAPKGGDTTKKDLKHLREELEGARKRLIGKAVIHKVHLDELGKDSDGQDDLGQLMSLQGEALGFRTAIHFMDRILAGEYKGIGAG